MSTTAMGELERSVMTLLWDHPGGMTAQQLRAALTGPDYAVTTVLTVLTRLTRKGFVGRAEDSRPHRYFAARSREEFLSELMADALGSAPNADDRAAVLARFVGAMDDADTEHLRSLIRRRRRP